MTDFEFELRGACNLLDRIAERMTDAGYVRESRVLANAASSVRNVQLQMYPLEPQEEELQCPATK